MSLETQPNSTPDPNVKQAVPFFIVTNIEASLRYYIDGLGFRMTNQWINEGKLCWCWLQLGGAALMLQERPQGRVPSGKPGEGVSVCFQCTDALKIYREITTRGIQSRQRPFVGNAMWVVPLTDPDGYKIEFESPTDAPEESKLEE